MRNDDDDTSEGDDDINEHDDDGHDHHYDDYHDDEDNERICDYLVTVTNVPNKCPEWSPS